MTKQNLDFYQELRVKIKNWARTDDGQSNQWTEYLLFAPDLFHLLCKLTLDKDIMIADKAKLAGAITYFISPIDLIPEGILGPIGYIDDIALAAYVLNSIINNSDPEVVRRHWAGENDVLDVIKQILSVADQMVGSGLWGRIKKSFS